MRNSIFRDIDQLNRAVQALEPGRALLYHKGHLALDRTGSQLVVQGAELMLELGTKKGALVRPEYPGIKRSKVGKGWGELYQKRLTPPAEQVIVITEYYIRRLM